LIAGPEFAGLVQFPELYILVSLGRYIELTPPAAIASAVIPALSPAVIAPLIVELRPGRYIDCDVLETCDILFTP
jgi:hypothetical protein